MSCSPTEIEVFFHTCRKRVLFGVLAHMVSLLPLQKIGCLTSTMVSGFPLVTVKPPLDFSMGPFLAIFDDSIASFGDQLWPAEKNRPRAYEKTSAGPQCGASLGRALAVRVHRSTLGDVGRWQERGEKICNQYEKNHVPHACTAWKFLVILLVFYVFFTFLNYEMRWNLK